MNKTQDFKFYDTGAGNVFAHFEGFGVSYNPAPGEGTCWAGEGSDGETALVKDGKYYILNGDFRKKYLKLRTFPACIEFWLANQDKRSSWSNEYKP